MDPGRKLTMADRMKHTPKFELTQTEMAFLDEAGSKWRWQNREREKQLATILSPLEMAIYRSGSENALAILMDDHIESGQRCHDTESQEWQDMESMLKKMKDRSVKKGSLAVAMALGIIKAQLVLEAKMAEHAAARGFDDTVAAARKFMLNTNGCDCAGCKVQENAFDMAMTDIKMATEVPLAEGWDKPQEEKHDDDV